MIRIFKESPESNANEPTFEMITSVRAHSQDVNAISWNPTIPGLLASASDDGDIKLWQFQE